MLPSPTNLGNEVPNKEHACITKTGPRLIRYYITQSRYLAKGVIILSYCRAPMRGIAVQVRVCVDISWETTSVFGGGIDCKPSPGTPVYTIGGC